MSYSQFKGPQEEEMVEGEQAELAADSEALNSERLEKELQQLKAEHARQLADQDNFCKRLQKEFNEQRRYAVEQYCKDLLPILDSLEAALELRGEAQTFDAVLQGVQATLGLFHSFFRQHGVEVIDPLQTTFNPKEHHAMKLEPLDGGKFNEIVEVFQKGYRLHERLLRPALVSIRSEATRGSA